MINTDFFSGLNNRTAFPIAIGPVQSGKNWKCRDGWSSLLVLGVHR